MDLIQHYLLEEHEHKEGRKQRLEDSIVGSLTTIGQAPKEKSFAPAWWHGDEDAYSSSLSAIAQLRSRG